jgi:hypothetical protein
MRKPKPLVAKLLHPDGRVIAVKPKNGTDFQLQELNEMVGGYIEIVRLPSDSDAIMVINEEGKLKGLPFNLLATMTARLAGDHIVGNALLCTSDQVK